ncbi:unnamed protein product [Closterium sp. Yama58-4]|nr:unnamed protein product [Closterium sp. Yama58-4]
MALEIRFRIPNGLACRRSDHHHSSDARSDDSRCDQPSVSSHVDVRVAASPEEPLRSVFTRLFQSHLRHCCLPCDARPAPRRNDEYPCEAAHVQRRGDDGVKSAEATEAVRGTQAVRFMVVGQVVYLSPDCTVTQAKLKPTCTIKVLPVKPVRGGGDGKRNDGLYTASDEDEGEETQHSGQSSTTAASCHGGLSEFKKEIWRDRHEVMKRWESHVHAVTQATGGIRGTGAREAPGKPQLLSRADMVHYLDVGGWWDAAACEWCFHHVVRLGPQRPLTMPTLHLFHSLLHVEQPRCTPLAHLNVVGRRVLEYSFDVPAFATHEEDAEASSAVHVQVHPRPLRVRASDAARLAG